MSAPKLASFGEGQVHLPRLADVVAERIRELILLGELQEGDRLPPLDKLIEQFGVSQSSMRQALRILEAEGLVAVQRGSIGGAVVQRPTARTAAYTLALVLRSQGAHKGDVAEALALLEPVCAARCARRPDRTDVVVPELRRANEAARAHIDEDEAAFNEAMTDFHVTLVRRCGNDTLTLLAGALGSIWLADMRAWATFPHDFYPTGADRLTALEFHERITELIEAGDEFEVAEAVTAHVDLTRIYRDEIDPTHPVDPQAVRLSR